MQVNSSKRNKKNTFLSFNEDSILNTSIARGINAVLLIFCSILTVGNEAVFSFNWRELFFIIIISLFISISLTFSIVNNTTFFEWDYYERKKKNDFSIIYMTVSSFFSFIICLYTYTIYFKIFDDCNILTIVILSIPIFIILINLLCITELCYPIFKNCLSISYVEEPPANWRQDNL